MEDQPHQVASLKTPLCSRRENLVVGDEVLLSLEIEAVPQT
jgi:hypothetical protein